jgi:hypothetical protein
MAKLVPEAATVVGDVAGTEIADGAERAEAEHAPATKAIPSPHDRRMGTRRGADASMQ